MKVHALCFWGMNVGILFEPVVGEKLPPGYYYAHIPSLGLTTHGLGLDGAREAARDLLTLWIAEKRANHEDVPALGECYFSTL